MKEENKTLNEQWIFKNISKLFVQVKDTQPIFNRKYITKKSLKTKLILHNVLQDYAFCIFAAQLEDIMFLNIAEQTLHWLNSQQIMVRVQPDIVTTPVPTTLPFSPKPCHRKLNCLVFLSIARGSYRTRYFICHSCNLTQNICKSWQ